MNEPNSTRNAQQAQDSVKKRIAVIVRRSLAAVTLILVLHYSSDFAAFVINMSSGFHEVEPGTWKSITTDLPAGSYFVSVGRPRSICDLRRGNTLIDSNRSTKNDVRDALLLGGSFEKSLDDSFDEIVLKCDIPRGFKTYLTSTPVLARRDAGLALQGWRFLTQVLLGPTAAGFLLLYIAISSIVRRQIRSPLRSKGQHRWRSKTVILVGFGIISFIYALSLAYLPRLWINGASAASYHTILRSVYAFAFSILTAAYSQASIPIFVLHSLQILTQSLIAKFSPLHVLDSYAASCSVFMFCTGYYAWKLSGERQLRTQYLLMGLAGAFTVLQPLDFLATFYAQKENLSPSLLAILSAGLIYIREHEHAVREESEIASLKIHAICDSIENTRELSAKVGEIALAATRFKRVRVLMDAHMLGAADNPGQIFIRVLETGYLKDTSKDEFFDLTLGRSPWMERALREQRPVAGRGTTDDAGFVVLPIGNHIFINLSDDLTASGEDISARLEVIEHLLPTLARLKDRIVEYSLKQCLALEKLRIKYGRTRFERRIGAIFTDIDGYSGLNSKYGLPFSEFVSDKYYPAMIKSIGNASAAENFIGDELNLVAIEDLLPLGMDIESAVGTTLDRILRFYNNEGANLCSNNGFPHLTVKIGIVIGPATIVCDNVKVRTAGQTVDEAKRLVTYADAGQILLRAWPGDPETIPGFASGEATPISQKKTLTRARELRPMDTGLLSKEESAKKAYAVDG